MGERALSGRLFRRATAHADQGAIAAGLSQRELAERLGLKEQQVQKYEATEYTSASLARIRAVIHALGVTVSEEVSPAR